MKTMKESGISVLWKAIFGILMLAVLASCENDSEIAQSPADEVDFSENAEIESDFDDVDNFATEGMDLEVYSAAAPEGSSSAKLAKPNRRHLPDCAEITHDHEAQVITIDFGESCEGRGGKVFSGKIIITYTDRKFIPGSIITTTFEDFFVDGKQIEGLRVSENISASLEDNPTFHVTLTDGKITWPDGAFATKDADKVKMWVRAQNPLNDEFHILEGSKSWGLNKEGVDYSTEVLEDIVYKNICKLEGVHIPVDGVKQVVKGGRTYTVDFGDGECDNIVTVTFGDEVVVMELRRKLRG